MAYLRFMCQGQVLKPLPSALVTALPSIKANATDLQSYAQRLNAGAANEEVTNKVIWGEEVDHIWFRIDLAIPIPIPTALQTKLPAIKDKIRQLKTYAVNTGMASFHGKYHVCHHDTGQLCESEQEI